MKPFHITLSLSVVLFIAGFICPPMGVIDGSVLTAVGLLFSFATLAHVPEIIQSARNGKTIRLQNGIFSATVSGEREPRDNLSLHSTED